MDSYSAINQQRSEWHEAGGLRQRDEDFIMLREAPSNLMHNSMMSLRPKPKPGARMSLMSN